MPLLRHVNDLRGVSPAAARTFHECLWLASAEGDVDPLGRKGEGMFWRVLGELAALTELSHPTQRRALAELRDEHALVRWRRVNPREALPGGARAKSTCCVYYVNVWAFVRLVKPGMDLAKSDHIDHSKVITTPPQTSQIPRVSDVPPQSVSSGISVVKFNHDHRKNPTRLPVLGDDDFRSVEIEILFDAWWVTLGSVKLADFQRSGPTATAVRAAIRRLLGAGVPAEALRDAIAAASDPAVGGKPHPGGETPFQWLQRHDLAHTHQIFRGSFDRLVDSARWHRQRVAARATIDSAARLRVGGGGTLSADPNGPPRGEEPRPATADEVAALMRAVARRA